VGATVSLQTMSESKEGTSSNQIVSLTWEEAAFVSVRYKVEDKDKLINWSSHQLLYVIILIQL